MWTRLLVHTGPSEANIRRCSTCGVGAGEWGAVLRADIPKRLISPLAERGGFGDGVVPPGADRDSAGTPGRLCRRSGPTSGMWRQLVVADAEEPDRDTRAPEKSPEAQEHPEIVWKRCVWAHVVLLERGQGPPGALGWTRALLCYSVSARFPDTPRARWDGMRWKVNSRPFHPRQAFNPTFQPSAGPTFLVMVTVRPPRLPPWHPHQSHPLTQVVQRHLPAPSQARAPDSAPSQSPIPPTQRSRL